MAKLSSGTLEAIRNFGRGGGMLTGSGQGLAPVDPMMQLGRSFGGSLKKTLGGLTGRDFRNPTEKYKDQLAELGTIETDEEQTQLLRLNLQLAAARGNRAEIAKATKAIQVHEANLRVKNEAKRQADMVPHKRELYNILARADDPYGQTTREEVGQYAVDNNLGPAEIDSVYSAFEKTLGPQKNEKYSDVTLVRDEEGVEWAVTQNNVTNEIALTPIGSDAESPTGKVEVISKTTGASGEDLHNQRLEIKQLENKLDKNKEEHKTYISLVKEGVDDLNHARTTKAQALELIEIITEIQKLGGDTAGLGAATRAKMAKLFGLDSDADLSLLEFDAESKTLVKKALEGFTNPTEGERQFAQDMSPSLGKSAKLNIRLLNNVIKLADRQITRNSYLINPKNDFNDYRNFLLNLDPLGKPDDGLTMPRRKASN
tara:strand:+ start:1281 stop:2567 length:1287 start_codon:yes stop_codon:yes gene_type:complete